LWIHPVRKEEQCSEGYLELQWEASAGCVYKYLKLYRLVDNIKTDINSLILPSDIGNLLVLYPDS
jgi:hypothetical protein